jgi:hypothetical protein
MSTDQAPLRIGSLLQIFILAMLVGPLLGGLTNAVAGRISPEYFRRVLRWEEDVDVSRRAVVQGIFEGGITGFVMAVLFTGVVGFVARGKSPISLSATYLAGIVASALIFWAIGGLAGWGLATMDPGWFQSQFYGAPSDRSEAPRFAFVGGSIWGLQFGGIASVILGCIIFRAHWHRLQR